MSGLCEVRGFTDGRPPVSAPAQTLEQRQTYDPFAVLAGQLLNVRSMAGGHQPFGLWV
jgi:hypothetical protein